MALIEWSETFSVDNEEIDQQHKKWIAIYNGAHERMMSGGRENTASLAEDALQSMQEYADYHFKFEEEYMQQLGYPELVQHRRAHRDFDNLIYQCNRDLGGESPVLNTQILKMLENWLVGHILGEDKKYCAYAASRV